MHFRLIGEKTGASACYPNDFGNRAKPGLAGLVRMACRPTFHLRPLPLGTTAPEFGEVIG